jgi:hypothetical protein
MYSRSGSPGGIALDQQASYLFYPPSIRFSLEIVNDPISNFISNAAYIIPASRDIASWLLR